MNVNKQMVLSFLLEARDWDCVMCLLGVGTHRLSHPWTQCPLTSGCACGEVDWAVHCLSSDWTGRGGASIYGKQFEDELHPDLKFTGKCVIGLDGQGRQCIVKACSFGCDSR